MRVGEGDFLASYYCNGWMYDDFVMTLEVSPNTALIIIFRPFKLYALRALDKLQNIAMDLIALGPKRKGGGLPCAGPKSSTL